MTDRGSSLIQFGFAYVPPSRFIGHSWSRYWRPRRLTLKGPGRKAIYRWLVWNFSIGGGS